MKNSSLVAGALAALARVPGAAPALASAPAVDSTSMEDSSDVMLLLRGVPALAAEAVIDQDDDGQELIMRAWEEENEEELPAWLVDSEEEAMMLRGAASAASSIDQEQDEGAFAMTTAWEEKDYDEEDELPTWLWMDSEDEDDYDYEEEETPSVGFVGEEEERILGRGGGKRNRANIFARKINKRTRRRCEKQCQCDRWLCNDDEKQCRRTCRADNTGGGRKWERDTCKFDCLDNLDVCLSGLTVTVIDPVTLEPTGAIISCEQDCKTADINDLDPFTTPLSCPWM